MKLLGAESLFGDVQRMDKRQVIIGKINFLEFEPRIYFSVAQLWLNFLLTLC